MPKNPLSGMAPINIDTAEKFVRDLLKAGVDRRKDAERLLAGYGEAVQREVTKQVTAQIGRLMKQMDQMERQIESLSKTLSGVAAMIPRPGAKAAATTTAKKSTAKKTTAKKTGTKKPVAKKPGTKKPAATKSTANPTVADNRAATSS